MGDLARNSSIFLIGMPGSGKSTVGKALAKHLNLSFCDTDREIERQTGVTISTIFEVEGEAGFRRRESAVLQAIAANGDQVVATGGGIILEAHNRELIRRSGLVVYLEATLDQLLARTAGSRQRPLLQGTDSLVTMKKLLETRRPLYQQLADLTIPSASLNARRSVQSICNWYGNLENPLTPT